MSVQIEASSDVCFQLYSRKIFFIWMFWVLCLYMGFWKEKSMSDDDAKNVLDKGAMNDWFHFYHFQTHRFAVCFDHRNSNCIAVCNWWQLTFYGLRNHDDYFPFWFIILLMLVLSSSLYLSISKSFFISER